jgi:hypothetical protein
LICIGNRYKYILKLTAISRYLDIKYKTLIVLQKQVDRYIAEFLFAYNYTSVPVPSKRSAPQPIIPIVDRFVYKDCIFKSVNRSVIQQHANKAHNQKHKADKDIYWVVRLQLWFGEKQEQYWVVDKSKQDEHDCQIRQAAI